MTSLISVVVAALDVEDVLPRQLDALAAQRDPGPWELVVADNGSRDGTRAVVDAFAAAHPELDVRLVDASARRGAGSARNAGVERSRGEVVAFCDADDVVSPGWLAALRAGLAVHDVVAGSYSSAGLNPEWLRRSRPVSQTSGLQPGPCSPWLPHAGAGNLALGRGLFASVGGFDPDCLYLEDTDLCWRLQLLAGARLGFWPDAAVTMQLRGTLRGSVRQGATYGAATAWLQARYARVPPVTPAPGAVEGRVHDRPWWLPDGADRGSLGFLLWQLGWRMGFAVRRLQLRSPRRRPAPLVLPTSSSSR
ncbi:glycosyltransferase family 2 protein [Quadrisphaera sp. KR29]|uniref:glycosyltransferase family 2 protein n=1 Tax=Quadrisphaera sp. KR29 TaxID=3461391 RepID=UPI0040448CE0